MLDLIRTTPCSCCGSRPDERGAILHAPDCRYGYAPVRCGESTGAPLVVSPPMRPLGVRRCRHCGEANGCHRPACRTQVVEGVMVTEEGDVFADPVVDRGHDRRIPKIIQLD